MGVFAVKLVGYLVPASILATPRPTRIANLLTVAMLAALVAVQTLGAGESIVLDARIPAVVLAAGLFALRVPYILVVLVAGVVAALLRNFGLMA
nr:AzlD domain-containing protein [Alpinimonas psychrophila]